MLLKTKRLIQRNQKENQEQAGQTKIEKLAPILRDRSSQKMRKRYACGCWGDARRAAGQLTEKYLQTEESKKAGDDASRSICSYLLGEHPEKKTKQSS
jgi:hypothetical protein